MSDEKTIWAGTPSQVLNFGSFVVCGIFFFLVFPLFVMIWKWLGVKNTKYELTTERLRSRFGILNKQTNEIELYRVRDYRLEEPFFLRMFSLGNIVMETSDRSHPDFVIRAVPNAEELRENLRTYVEQSRRRTGVRELDVE